MKLLAKRNKNRRLRNWGSAYKLTDTEPPLSGEIEDEMTGSSMEGENNWPPTAWKLQWAWVLIHWKVMQLKVTLRINSQPDKNRIMTKKNQHCSCPTQVWPDTIQVLYVLCNYINKCRITWPSDCCDCGHLKNDYMTKTQMHTLKLHRQHFSRLVT